MFTKTLYGDGCDTLSDEEKKLIFHDTAAKVYSV